MSVFTTMELVAEAVPGETDEVPWGETLREPFAALADGNAAALEAVWELAGRRLYALALWRTGNREDASDVVQEVFARLASRRAELRDVRAPGIWLLSVTHHASVDLLRRRARRTSEPLERAALVVATSDDPDRRIDAERASIHLSRLPATQREAVALRHVSGCSFREIGRITGVPTFTAASRCRLGLQRLRRLMEGSR